MRLPSPPLPRPSTGMVRPSERRCDNRSLDKEMANYAAAVASAGPIESLLSEISVRDARRARLNAELDRLLDIRPIASLDKARMKAAVTRRLAEWRSMIGRNPKEVRTLLGEILDERLTFTPETDKRGARIIASGGTRSWAGSSRRRFPREYCDPGGIRTRDLDLERVASLARLDDGVDDRTRQPIQQRMIADPGLGDNRLESLCRRRTLHARRLKIAFRQAGSTGFTTWTSKPALCDRSRSSGRPRPVNAINIIRLPSAVARMRCATS
jgi:hypothetical protein